SGEPAQSVRNSPSSRDAHSRRSVEGLRCSLCKYAAAPEVGASEGKSAASHVEHKKTTVEGCSVRMRRVASTPFISGMLMSMSTRPGSSEVASSMASGPEAAALTSSNPSVRRSTARAAERNGTWSSTNRTATEEAMTLEVSHRAVRRRRVVPPSVRGGHPPGLGEVDEDRLHAAVRVALLAQAELGEDRIGVLFHRSFR